MQIRTLKESDIPQASKIVGRNYSKKYEKASFMEMEAMFKNYVIKPQYIVAEDKGKIIGLSGYIQSWMDYNIYNIFWVNVDKNYQGKGIGKLLVNKVINIIKKKKNVKMILLTASIPKFYSKNFGFKTLATFKTHHNKLMGLNLD